MKIGFVGLGNMGSGMANNILKKIENKSDLYVYTRTPEKISKMVEKGASGCSSLEDLVSKVDIILTCLPNVETSRNLIMGSGGICDLANSDQVIVDHSTVDVKTSKDCYEYAQNKDVNFLDAPISGGPGGAADGTLTIMVGGKEEITIYDNDGYLIAKSPKKWKYREMRDEVAQLQRVVSYATSAIMLNHVVSMIDAVWISRKKNSQVSYNIKPIFDYKNAHGIGGLTFSLIW